MANPATHPINFLQEFCVRNARAFPQFTFQGFLGEDHARRFFYRCEFGKYDVVGSGPQKKLAKQEAAKKMVKLLDNENNFFKSQKEFSSRGELNSSTPISEMEAVYLSECSIGMAGKNSISTLQEYCQKERLPMPNYLECGSKGLFIIKCLIQEKQTIGSGTNKKQAKLSAASKMCKELNVQFLNPELYESKDNIRSRKCVSNEESCLQDGTRMTDLAEDLSLEKKAIPTLDKFCALNKQLTVPNFNFKNSFTKTFYEFECNVGSFVGRGVHETVEGAKELAAKFVLNELLKAGYCVKDTTELDVGNETLPVSGEDYKNNGNDFFRECSSESDDGTQQKNLSLQYPIIALNKLCNSHKSLPLPRYSVKQEDSGKNSIVKCQVGRIIEEGRDVEISNAKVLAARKVIERLITEGFMRGDLREVDNEEEACYGEQDPKGALENLCSIYNLNPPMYRIKERHRECFVITCSAANISGEGRDVTKDGAKKLAAKMVLHELLNLLNIGHSGHEYSNEEKNAQTGHQNKEKTAENRQITSEVRRRFYNKGKNYCRGWSKPFYQNWRKHFKTNPNKREEQEPYSGDVRRSKYRGNNRRKMTTDGVYQLPYKRSNTLRNSAQGTNRD